MKLTLPLLAVILTLFLGGCKEDSPALEQGVRMDLCVRNDSALDIANVIVQSGERRERFGVVGAGFGKTIAFGFGQVEQTITIEWMVDVPEAKPELATIALPMPTDGEVTLVYQKDGTWTAVQIVP